MLIETEMVNLKKIKNTRITLTETFATIFSSISSRVSYTILENKTLTVYKITNNMENIDCH